MSAIEEACGDIIRVPNRLTCFVRAGRTSKVVMLTMDLQPDQDPSRWDDYVSVYETVFEPFSMTFAARAIATVDLHPGARYLDVGCGSGGAALLLASMGCRVDAVDASAAMVERVRARARTAGASITSHVMDGQALNFEDDSFDAAISVFGVILFPDAVRGLVGDAPRGQAGRQGRRGDMDASPRTSSLPLRCGQRSPAFGRITRALRCRHNCASASFLISRPCIGRPDLTMLRSRRTQQASAPLRSAGSPSILHSRRVWTRRSETSAAMPQPSSKILSSGSKKLTARARSADGHRLCRILGGSVI